MSESFEIGRVIRAIKYEFDEEFVLSSINSDKQFVLSGMNSHRLRESPPNHAST